MTDTDRLDAPQEREVIYVYRDDYEAAVRERDELRAAADRLLAYLADSADVGGEPGIRVVSWRSPQVRALRAALHREDGA